MFRFLWRRGSVGKFFVVLGGAELLQSAASLLFCGGMCLKIMPHGAPAGGISALVYGITTNRILLTNRVR